MPTSAPKVPGSHVLDAVFMIASLLSSCRHLPGVTAGLVSGACTELGCSHRCRWIHPRSMGRLRMRYYGLKNEATNLLQRGMKRRAGARTSAGGRLVCGLRRLTPGDCDGAGVRRTGIYSIETLLPGRNKG